MHAISNAGALEAGRYAADETSDSRARSFGQLCDRARDGLTWQQIEEAMAEAPAAQRKEFWSQMLKFIDTDPRFIAKQNVSLIAGPLQEAVALAVDAQVRKEFDL
ncbi:hypothetical protein SAMN05216206_2794 [Pseudomonas guineae]|uniref:Uncharacterized protein n=1 Tax=Pseudomonas guineae TaxID=425504 RepID=A0A1I3KEP4_9PSED|nr:hypothetical protein [Pseudomonas guineae]SFI70675.1 hypothetical protein SAMN05216206_2794 [Pseudomonas guineae]